MDGDPAFVMRHCRSMSPDRSSLGVRPSQGPTSRGFANLSTSPPVTGDEPGRDVQPDVADLHGPSDLRLERRGLGEPPYLPLVGLDRDGRLSEALHRRPGDVSELPRPRRRVEPVEAPGRAFRDPEAHGPGDRAHLHDDARAPLHGEVAHLVEVGHPPAPGSAQLHRMEKPRGGEREPRRHLRVVDVVLRLRLRCHPEAAGVGHVHRGQCVPNRTASDRRIFCIGGTACGHADARGASRRKRARRHVCKSLSVQPVVKERILSHRWEKARSTLYLRALRVDRPEARSPVRFTVVRHVPGAGRRGRRPLPPILPRRGLAREGLAPPSARGVRTGLVREGPAPPSAWDVRMSRVRDAPAGGTLLILR